MTTDHLVPFSCFCRDDSQRSLDRPGGRNRTIIRPTDPVRYYLSMDEVAGLEVSGAGSISADSFVANHLGLDVSGAGEISIDSLTAISLALDICRVRGLRAAGQAPGKVIDISGSGEYQAGNLESETVDVPVSCAGEAAVWTGQTLNVDISCAGAVACYSDPSISQDIRSPGGIRGLDSR